MYLRALLAVLLLASIADLRAETSQALERDADTKTLRIFIFAGQSNMVGSDSKARDIKRFPPFVGLDKPQDKVLFSYNIKELEAKGQRVELAGIFYHVGENDMSFGPCRKNAARWLQSTVAKSRQDLALPALKWYVSQQPPTDEKGLNAIDVTANLAAIAAADPAFIHLKAFDLPPQEEKLVITTAGIVQLGELLAQGYLEHR